MLTLKKQLFLEIHNEVSIDEIINNQEGGIWEGALGYVDKLLKQGDGHMGIHYPILSAFNTFEIFYNKKEKKKT